MAYFECIEDDIQFDGVLAADGVVDLASIRKGCENDNRDEEQQCPQDVCFLRRGGKGFSDRATVLSRSRHTAKADRIGRIVKVYKKESKQTMNPNKNICHLRYFYCGQEHV